ncbi:MAG: cytochrome c biogenesis protein transmembrane region [Candidatus Falkowbacteria bacterium GW2011_GWC2_38_22]|uniref:Cytochrome c biogenesis protein transmembrane region n=1 Tax=Candidatus Falkowbacteria bacterium GW2011_GWE1_38_31 TaxID=1618638 RepID=A0A0G0JSK6_9BACT|nr:MAG: cytochrome c biogenesis protein transmembrane region [Candidatus Falkowbacteria bacterium GW2011_GWF2_38_1205]KKQ61710.1 MAG: cytochrome c biogenesis protein transmembrane region [Candidatus Falkowbacteria bacterium GW2011_GWC2_38_22]KKQ63675.1 MAG: cytochrome c biogenesis protein transmembrane region [Candidatus Falkowbacteria bacterium GW2011_GWF1_38_22]KKQ65909.1 MAG: cytochrome c biogenesis protein transmembrane region [Candidatus Falkowbacteria bacterium GW2011_GWE2_38_254]KKQ70538
MELINALIDNYNIPVLTAFLLGFLTSISPCPLATNITAIAYISREIKTVKNTLLNGLFYTLGRGISYTLLATLIYFGISSFSISRIFQGWGDKVLGPVLIVIGLIMFDVIKLNLNFKNQSFEKVKDWLSRKGYIGSMLLGVLFALAFCPYSGVLFFGMFMPLVIGSGEGLLLPPLFALGTGLPVIIFSFLLAFSLGKVGKLFNIMQKIEKVMRYGIASVFILTGLYYTQYLVKYFINLF